MPGVGDGVSWVRIPMSSLPSSPSSGPGFVGVDRCRQVQTGATTGGDFCSGYGAFLYISQAQDGKFLN